jgi:hypothetical protein
VKRNGKFKNTRYIIKKWQLINWFLHIQQFNS